MGIHWTGIVFAWGGALSCGYWTTDFLVVQRTLAAKDLRAAKMAPIIGAYFKMIVPFIVILPGLLGLAVLPFKLVPENAVGPGLHSYNELLPIMLARYCGPGLLGLGITALIAGFMSGMAGNVTAFATVWTYDIYRPYLKKRATDAHYVKVGRWSTILGVLISIGAAYFVTQFKSIMDYMQALSSFFFAPLFGTVLLGMLWKRGTSKGWLLGLAGGQHVVRCHVHPGEARPQQVGLDCPVAARQGYGGEPLPRPVVLPDLLRGHRHRQPLQQNEDGGRVARFGPRIYRHP